MEYNEEHDETIVSQYSGKEDTYDTLLLRLDPSTTLETIRHMLLNERYDPKFQRWENIEGLKPRMTRAGVEKVMLELYGRMSVDKVLGNLKEKRINIFIRELGDVILQFLFLNADEFEISEKEFSSIAFMITQNVDMFLRRSIDALQNKLIHNSMQQREVVSRMRREPETSNVPQEGGLRMPFFGGRR